MSMADLNNLPFSLLHPVGAYLGNGGKAVALAFQFGIQLGEDWREHGG